MKTESKFGIIITVIIVVVFVSTNLIMSQYITTTNFTHGGCGLSFGFDKPCPMTPVEGGGAVSKTISQYHDNVKETK